MSNHDSRPIPSSRQLIKASGIAAVIAALALTVAVLPAEYGIDPTGIGKALGLTKLHEVGDDDVVISEPSAATGGETQVPGAASPVGRHEMSYKTQEMTITLPPNKGAEIKAVMQTGDSFVFNWKSAAPVNFDMHGEPFNAKNDEFTSYWKDLLKSEAHGSFTAPFGGTHGWYWRNRSSDPVTVTVTVTGFFEQLYMP